MVKRVKCTRLVDDSIDDFLIRKLWLEGPEEAVPDDEDPAVVLVEAVLVTPWKRDWV